MLHKETMGVLLNYPSQAGSSLSVFFIPLQLFFSLVTFPGDLAQSKILKNAE